MSRVKGKRLSGGALEMIMKRRARGAGLKTHLWPHRLRHTAATLLADEGLEEGALRNIMG